MKKLLMLLMIFTGCKSTCVLSQIKDQVIQAGVGCTAPIPDYTTVLVKAKDPCGNVPLTQTPTAGTMLTAANRIATITIKGTGSSGNPIQTTFKVTMAIPDAVFAIDPSLLSYNWKEVDQIYTFAELMVKELALRDRICPYDSVFMPQQIGASYFDGIERVRYTKDAVYWNNGVWIHNLDGVYGVDSTLFDRKALVVLKYPGQRRYFSIK